MENEELKKAVESLLFITDQPLPAARMAQVLGAADAKTVTEIIAALRRDYEQRGSGVQIIEIAEGFQMASLPAHSQFIRKLYADRMVLRLSSAALETLSIIAYRQPITRAEIEEVRGVEVIAALETLLDKRLIRVVGRKEQVGRPLLYGTTPEFLRRFGLKGLSELPSLDTLLPPPAADAPAAVPAVGGAQPSVDAAPVIEITQDKSPNQN